MDFTCPHCGKTSPVVIHRRGNTGEKANAARKRNALLGGRRKASDADLARIFFSRTGNDWTCPSFVDAVKKQTGFTYSRTQGFALLKKFRSIEKGMDRHIAKTNKVKFIGGLDAPVSAPKPSSVQRGKAVTK